MKSRLLYSPTVAPPKELDLTLLLTFKTQAILNQQKNEKYSAKLNKQSGDDFTVQNATLLPMYRFPTQESTYFIFLQFCIIPAWLIK